MAHVPPDCTGDRDGSSRPSTSAVCHVEPGVHGHCHRPESHRVARRTAQSTAGVRVVPVA